MVRGGGRSGGLLYPSEKSRLDFGIHPKKAGLTKSGRLRFVVVREEFDEFEFVHVGTYSLQGIFQP